ncbi:ImmA/IrrE family metallo-endopeptidase [Steroidobacter agaridevorans]|uniref:ImmA/IrrE family metallo-endopeptidase n=1 Tax=Steroidobacter agaridevorans TaxID=2695856 RepID=UPI001AD91E50|nr:ImmA/IrrE family metallo-endopeptidase [Steroidobacter agaridevorans]
MDSRIRKSRELLKNPYAHLNGAGEYDAVLPALDQPVLNAAQVMNGYRRGRPFAKRDLELIARTLHRLMWTHRERLLGAADVEPAQIVDPALALKALGYRVVEHESLGEHAAGKDTYEVAGLMDRDHGEVRVSRRFDPWSRNFTAAHELGHALLHTGSGLHRDRAPDGSAARSRDPQEREADEFAAYFLLPEKLVREAFINRFLAAPFELTDATAFALTAEPLAQLKRKCRSERDLSRRLASAHSYNSRHFHSLDEKFGVSVEVMAIRLEELGLVRF